MTTDKRVTTKETGFRQGKHSLNIKQEKPQKLARVQCEPAKGSTVVLSISIWISFSPATLQNYPHCGDLMLKSGKETHRSILHFHHEAVTLPELKLNMMAKSCNTIA